jgi:DNA polymerase/3'-5' exonuclease PolX
MASRFDGLLDALDELALHYRVMGKKHVARQYENAAESIMSEQFIPPDPARLDGIGESMREEIAEWRAFGRIERLERFREQRPYLTELCEVKSIGPSTAESLYDETGVETIEELTSLSNEELQSVTGIGPKTARSIQQSTRQMK